MSGILLPGQDKEPEPSGKIEIAKGFSRSKPKPKPEAETPAEAPSSAATPPPPQPRRPQGAAPRGQQPDFAFPPSGAQVQCPGCGTPFTVPVFTIIDLGENPELRPALLGGQINVASCPNCGSGGPLSAPLMVHDPDNKFLGVFVPQTDRMGDAQAQRVIGDLSQTLMRKLPSEKRRGYMLQPKQFFDWQRFTEVLWGFEGVTPEMLRRQRDQAALLQKLANLANDPTALELALQREQGLVDADFFAMLDRVIVMSGTPPEGQQNPLMAVRELLLDKTEAGAQVRKRETRIRQLLEEISPSTTRESLLETVIGLWDEEDGEQMVATLAVAAAPLMDYQFLVLLADRIESAEDETQRQALQEIREVVVEVQEQQRESQAATVQQSQALLQEVLQASDPAAKLRELSDYIDERFLSLLAANIQTAQQRKASAAEKRLRQIYQMALQVMQENLPEDIRLINQLLTAPDPAAARALMKENRHLVNRDLLDSVKSLEGDLRQNGQAELADRLKSLHGQMALMV